MTEFADTGMIAAGAAAVIVLISYLLLAFSKGLGRLASAVKGSRARAKTRKWAAAQEEGEGTAHGMSQEPKSAPSKDFDRTVSERPGTTL